jgi:short-subunit dehydrogenase
MADISGKRIVVVGATGGLGSEISRALSAAGANLVLVGRSAEKLQGLGIEGELLTTDLLTPGAADALITYIAESGPIDGLVIAHGVVAFGPTVELDDSTLSTLVTLNQTTPMQLIRSAIPSMRAAKEAGSEPFIVTISGIVAESPTAGLAAYSSSKAGLAAFMNVMRRELRREGIRALDARPSHTETELSKHPLAGQAPTFGAGFAPSAVAARIVQGIVDDEADLPSGSFSV